MKLFSLLSIVLYTSCSLASVKEIYHPKSQRYLSMEEFIAELPDQGAIALGEFHNHPPIQKAQAQIINEKVNQARRTSDFSVHWEFLNHTDQTQTDQVYFQFLANLIDAKEFIEQTAGAQNLQYAPIIQAIKDNDGKLYGINLPRPYKQQVIKGGIRSIDSTLVPDHFYVGNERYRERFIQAMGAHVPADKIEAYFTAQCLTDSVMAHQINLHSDKALNFIVAGSFHTDFRDATIERLEKITNSQIHTFKFASESLNTSEEITNFKKYDQNYGHYADYIIVTK